MHHEGVHVDVGLETATVAGVAEGGIFKLLFSFPGFLHFCHYLFVGLDSILGLEILLLDFSDPFLILGFELIEFVEVHLPDS